MTTSKQSAVAASLHGDLKPIPSDRPPEIFSEMENAMIQMYTIESPEIEIEVMEPPNIRVEMERNCLYSPAKVMTYNKRFFHAILG